MLNKGPPYLECETGHWIEVTIEANGDDALLNSPDGSSKPYQTKLSID